MSAGRDGMVWVDCDVVEPFDEPTDHKNIWRMRFNFIENISVLLSRVPLLGERICQTSTRVFVVLSVTHRDQKGYTTSVATLRVQKVPS